MDISLQLLQTWISVVLIESDSICSTVNRDIIILKLRRINCNQTGRPNKEHHERLIRVTNDKERLKSIANEVQSLWYSDCNHSHYSH
jgi:hypothetical protein